MGKEVKNIVDKYSNLFDLDFINQVIEQTGKLDDFQMNKTTLMNISEWALNGNSDEEIRKRLELTPTQWHVLVNVCPTLVLVMKDSRALADTIIAGSLFQTAIGTTLPLSSVLLLSGCEYMPTTIDTRNVGRGELVEKVDNVSYEFNADEWKYTAYWEYDESEHKYTKSVDLPLAHVEYTYYIETHNTLYIYTHASYLVIKLM